MSTITIKSTIKITSAGGRAGRPPRAILLLAAAALLAIAGRSAAATPDCLGCHGEQVPAAAYAAGAHRDLACTACHQPDAAAPAPVGEGPRCAVAFAPMSCASCHAQQAAEHTGSVHDSERLPVPCWECHADIHTITPMRGDKPAASRLCAGCHSRQEPYFDSAHHKALAEGSKDAPGCPDCHGTHAIAGIDNDAQGRDFHTRACLKCHEDREMMERNDVTLVAGQTFFNSFHGKNVRLGYPERVAGCADCHGSHAVWPAEDPRSLIHDSQITATCRQCHPRATHSLATLYINHAEDHDRTGSPALFRTKVFMTGLLVVTFLFFWVHSLLWGFRSFVHQREREERTPAVHAPRRVYRRFRTVHIVLHIVVIVSFLALSVTGLPLKFSGTDWGRYIMGALGGTENARLIHHGAAVVTFGYFAVAVAMSLRFLFSRRHGGSTVRQRLLGPDSLFPNPRDWRDLKAMFRWFFFKGPKPTFERWTYWEKFDFMAVFWGIAAIGGSGLMLWFPEFFARFLPGWMFNVATIIHSDEALLATGFIFTVHFFNAFFRPDKFPMDTVIFNGRISHEEMLEERADQLRRYEAEGRLEAIAEERPRSLVWEFAFRVFGFLAVAVGLGLTVLVFAALALG